MKYLYSLFQYTQTWHYVIHVQMHVDISKHSQFRLYNINLNYIKNQHARCLELKSKPKE